jgi:hypothetical protein
MNIKPIGSNMTELQVNGNRILFSYETPVAAWVDNRGTFVRTDTFWSSTTCRHINKWLKMNDWIETVEFVEQQQLDGMVA